MPVAVQTPHIHTNPSQLASLSFFSPFFPLRPFPPLLLQPNPRLPVLSRTSFRLGRRGGGETDPSGLVSSTVRQFYTHTPSETRGCHSFPVSCGFQPGFRQSPPPPNKHEPAERRRNGSAIKDGRKLPPIFACPQTAFRTGQDCLRPNTKLPCYYTTATNTTATTTTTIATTATAAATAATATASTATGRQAPSLLDRDYLLVHPYL